MRRVRRVIVLAVAAIPLGLGLSAVPSPAEAFCDTSDGCSPCTFDVVISGKNTHINWHYC